MRPTTEEWGAVCVSPNTAEKPLGSYLVCSPERVVWLDGHSERAAPVDGDGWMLVAASGDGVADGSAARAAVRVLTRLAERETPSNLAAVLSTFVLDAHLRMRDATPGPVRPGASLAVVWMREHAFAWLTVGDARVLAIRGDRSVALGGSVAGSWQRFIAGSRGLGDDDALHVMERRTIGQAQIRPGDRLVLAAGPLARASAFPDGLGRPDNPQGAAELLLHRVKQNGGEEAGALIVWQGSIPPLPLSA